MYIYIYTIIHKHMDATIYEHAFVIICHMQWKYATRQWNNNCDESKYVFMENPSCLDLKQTNNYIDFLLHFQTHSSYVYTCMYARLEAKPFNLKAFFIGTPLANTELQGN